MRVVVAGGFDCASPIDSLNNSTSPDAKDLFLCRDRSLLDGVAQFDAEIPARAEAATVVTRDGDGCDASDASDAGGAWEFSPSDRPRWMTCSAVLESARARISDLCLVGNSLMMQYTAGFGKWQRAGLGAAVSFAKVWAYSPDLGVVCFGRHGRRRTQSKALRPRRQLGERNLRSRQPAFQNGAKPRSGAKALKQAILAPWLRERCLRPGAALVVGLGRHWSSATPDEVALVTCALMELVFRAAPSAPAALSAPAVACLVIIAMLDVRFEHIPQKFGVNQC